MSTYYWIFTEAKVNNDWILLDPIKEDESAEETYFSGSRTYFEEAFDEIRYGNSEMVSLDELSEDLRSALLSNWYINVDRVSEDVRSLIRKELISLGESEKKIEDDFIRDSLLIPFGKITEEGKNIILPEAAKQFSYHLYSYPYKELEKIIGNNRYMHHGWVSKDNITLYEIGEIEELWPLSLEELSPIANVPKETAELLLKGYKYMEWDNSSDWLFAFKEIKRAVDKRVEAFMDANGLKKKPEVRLIAHSEY